MSTPSPKSPEPSEKHKKYDRQLRLVIILVPTLRINLTNGLISILFFEGRYYHILVKAM